jgi:hypothetical protein
LLTILLSGLLAPLAQAGEADVIDVQVTRSGEDTYRFDVTVQHADQGWNHYADQWQVLDSDGKVLGTRVLHHPHADEQPFTRSLPDVLIPPGTAKVIVRTRDSVHGYGGQEMTVEVPR